MKNKKLLCSVCFLFTFMSVLWGQNITVKGNDQSGRTLSERNKRPYHSSVFSVCCCHLFLDGIPPKRTYPDLFCRWVHGQKFNWLGKHDVRCMESGCHNLYRLWSIFLIPVFYRKKQSNIRYRHSTCTCILRIPL